MRCVGKEQGPSILPGTLSECELPGRDVALSLGGGPLLFLCEDYAEHGVHLLCDVFRYL